MVFQVSFRPVKVFYSFILSPSLNISRAITISSNNSNFSLSSIQQNWPKKLSKTHKKTPPKLSTTLSSITWNKVLPISPPKRLSSLLQMKQYPPTAQLSDVSAILSETALSHTYPSSSSTPLTKFFLPPVPERKVFTKL